MESNADQAEAMYNIYGKPAVLHPADSQSDTISVTLVSKVSPQRDERTYM